jgi:hypothetical protein
VPKRGHVAIFPSMVMMRITQMTTVITDGRVLLLGIKI